MERSGTSALGVPLPPFHLHPPCDFVGGDAHAVERSGTSTLGVHRPLQPSTVPVPCSCPVIPSQSADWRGNPSPAPAGAASPRPLCEGGVTAIGRDGGRDNTKRDGLRRLFFNHSASSSFGTGCSVPFAREITASNTQTQHQTAHTLRSSYTFAVNPMIAAMP